MEFDKRYAKLNTSQKQAVDAIDGPVMVIAGPGTGKTELLSVRVANILQKTDILPENILCLTFTESGASAMRERLTEIIGKEAYNVAVHTFHSFGTEVINQNGQFFYQGAHFLPADELSSYEIIQDIFNKLKYNNPIASKLNDEYTHLSDSLKIISELKKSGLTSDELLNILDENNDVIEKTEQLLSPLFATRISKDTALQAKKYINEIRKSNGNIISSTAVPLSQVLADSLENAIDETEKQNSTKPITAWRNMWFKKDHSDNFVLKSRQRQEKLRAISFVYEKYLSKMQQSALYDFDDMILRVVHAMEVFNDLRFNLQEKYQYIMVDEFQDTNMAQMRILHNLTNNIVQGDTPNIMVVGDDDQAIYSFQGADVSNIINFRNNYPKTKLITLTENYRSNANILDGSRDIIIQGNNRLENIYPEINKKLLPKNNDINKTFLRTAETIADERSFIVNDIKSRIESGEKPNDIAILTRRHHEINSLLPYFSLAGIAVNYERRDNVLEIAPIKLLEQIAGLLIDISKGRHDDINAKLPEMLAHKMWNIKPFDLWQLSIEAYNGRLRWLDVMSKQSQFIQLHNWLIETASVINDTPLEQMLDIIIGKNNLLTDDNEKDFVSPFFDYFFSQDRLLNNSNEYLLYLEALRTIRSKLREYHPNKTPTLFTFIEFINLNRKIGSTISVIRRSIQSKNAINIMTAHKSKGLEFNTVYIANAVDSAWGKRARSRNRLINYPENLPLAPAGETEDERLRLFYVAITRAKHQLIISYSLSDDNGKNTLLAEFLVNSKWTFKKIPISSNIADLIETAEMAWYQPLLDPSSTKMKDLLLPTLENYKLSVTHLHNFLDVTRGGPANFLLQNLLHFPSAKSPNAAFGTAIHDTIQSAHMHLTSTGKKQAVEDIISNFEKNLKNQHMNIKDFQDFLQKGSVALQNFFDKKYDNFKPSQQTELNFVNQHSIVDKAHLTGKLDLADIDTKTKSISITDYKTGKPSLSWNGKTEFEKIKLHKYKQQLIYYKLLVENARDYHNFSVQNSNIQYIEPTLSGDLVSLDIDFNKEELDYTSKLINAVWSHIIKLDLPDITSYDSSYKGILAFEQDLIDDVI